jgi:prepilin-type N-terminal cleavage/methylation domain-containing protein
MIFRIKNKQRTGGRGQSFVSFLNPEKGLTLVEVLLAVSILAMGIVGVLRGYASSIATLEAGQYTIDAVNLLRMKAAEVEILISEKEGISQESGSGSFEAPFEDFLWEWAIRPAGEEDLYLLSMNVSSNYNPREFSLTTYVADKKKEEEK